MTEIDLVAVLRQAMEAAKERASHHNHMTRDIKPVGECPACDAYHARREALR